MRPTRVLTSLARVGTSNGDVLVNAIPCGHKKAFSEIQGVTFSDIHDFVPSNYVRLFFTSLFG